MYCTFPTNNIRVNNSCGEPRLTIGYKYHRYPYTKPLPVQRQCHFPSHLLVIMSSTQTVPPQSQEASAENAKVKMNIPRPPTFTNKQEERDYLKGRLAAAFRIFGKNGYDEGMVFSMSCPSPKCPNAGILTKSIGVAGHITVRDPIEPTSFWVNPFGVSFSQIKASDLIRVSHEGKVIEGGPCRLLNAAAFMIHSAIHTARPEVMCAAHSHSIHGRAFCSLGRPLDIISQDSCAFYNVPPPYFPWVGLFDGD